MLVSGRVVQKSLRQGLFKMVEESTNLNAHSPDKIKHSQDKIKHSPDKIKHSSDKIKHSSDKIKHSPDKIKHSPDKIKHSSDKIKHSPDKIKHSPEKLNYFLHFSATVRPPYDLAEQFVNEELFKKITGRSFKNFPGIP